MPREERRARMARSSGTSRGRTSKPSRSVHRRRISSWGYSGRISSVLEGRYISTIERYSGEQITYSGDSLDGNQAIARTKFLTKQGKEVPIDYRMLRHGDRWLIYDVLVENVGLVSNYRTQFNQIIRTSSFEELGKRMRGHELLKEAS